MINSEPIKITNEREFLATFIEKSLNLYVEVKNADESRGNDIDSQNSRLKNKFTRVVNSLLESIKDSGLKNNIDPLGEKLKEGFDNYIQTMDTEIEKMKTKAIANLDSGGLPKTLELVEPNVRREEIARDENNPYLKAAKAIRNEKTTWLKITDCFKSIGLKTVSKWCIRKDEQSKDAAIGKVIGKDIVDAFKASVRVEHNDKKPNSVPLRQDKQANQLPDR